MGDLSHIVCNIGLSFAQNILAACSDASQQQHHTWLGFSLYLSGKLSEALNVLKLYDFVT